MKLKRKQQPFETATFDVDVTDTITGDKNTAVVIVTRIGDRATVDCHWHHPASERQNKAFGMAIPEFTERLMGVAFEALEAGPIPIQNAEHLTATMRKVFGGGMG